MLTTTSSSIQWKTSKHYENGKEGINYIVFQFGDNWYYYDTRKDFEFQILKYVGDRKH